MVFCKEQSLGGLSQAPQKPEQMLSWWQGHPESWTEGWGAMGVPHLPAPSLVGNSVNAKCIVSALGDVPGVVGAAQALTDMVAPAPSSPGCLCKPHAEELWRWDPSGALRGWEGTVDAQHSSAVFLHWIYSPCFGLQLSRVAEVSWELCSVPLGWRRFRRQSVCWGGMADPERREDTRLCCCPGRTGRAGGEAPDALHLPGVQVAARRGCWAPELRGGGVREPGPAAWRPVDPHDRCLH